MVAGVEKHVESDRAGRDDLPLHVQLLGALTISRNGAALKLPASRKVRALLAYLALAPHAVPRSQLCELLWERRVLKWRRSAKDFPDTASMIF